MTIPDAPWIRDAENYGPPEQPNVRCPICDREFETIYIDANGEVCGCDKCVRARDADEWFQEELEKAQGGW